MSEQNFPISDEVLLTVVWRDLRTKLIPDYHFVSRNASLIQSNHIFVRPTEMITYLLYPFKKE